MNQSAFIKTAADTQARVRALMPAGRGKYLFQLAKNDKTKYRIPGGGIEGNETPLQALIRELKEEFARDVSPDNLVYKGHDHRPEYAQDSYYEWKNHGMKPGLYQASNNPEEKVHLAKRRPGKEGYLGPDLSKLVQMNKSAFIKTAARGDQLVKQIIALANRAKNGTPEMASGALARLDRSLDLSGQAAYAPQASKDFAQSLRFAKAHRTSMSAFSHPESLSLIFGRSINPRYRGLAERVESGWPAEKMRQSISKPTLGPGTSLPRANADVLLQTMKYS